MFMKAATTALLVSALSLPPSIALSQSTPNEAFNTIAAKSCEGYRNNLINVIRNVTRGTSPEAALERGESRMSSGRQRNLIIQALESTAASEKNPALRDEIKRAIESYKRGGQIKDFERSLGDFVQTCTQQRITQLNKKQGQALPNPDRQQIQQPQSNDRSGTKGDAKSLPARDSYL